MSHSSAKAMNCAICRIKSSSTHTLNCSFLDTNLMLLPVLGDDYDYVLWVFLSPERLSLLKMLYSLPLPPLIELVLSRFYSQNYGMSVVFIYLHVEIIENNFLSSCNRYYHVYHARGLEDCVGVIDSYGNAIRFLILWVKSSVGSHRALHD